MPVLAYLPPKVVRTYQPRRVGGGGAGRRAGGSLDGRLAPPRSPGKGGPYNPVLRAPTPYQPGAGPAPLLGAWAMLGLGLGVLGKLLWDALNHRMSPVQTPAAPGVWVMLPTASNVSFTINGKFTNTEANYYSCSTGALSITGGGTTTPAFSTTASGVGFRKTGAVASSELVCAGGTTSPGSDINRLEILKANGGIEARYQASADVVNWSTIRYGGRTTSAITEATATYQGQVYDGSTTSVPLTPDVARSQAVFPTPATSRPPAPEPAAPMATNLPATVPGSTPAPAPAAASGGLPATTPATAPAPTTVPTVTTTITRVTPGSQTQTLTATGVTTSPAPAPIVQTPAQAVLIGSTLIGGPGAAPPPGPGGTAAELGRIEKKMELALDKISPLGGLVDALDLLGALLDLLEMESPGGSYSIRPACGTDAQGAPLPVIEVPISSGLGVVGAIVPRLDAIAELLDIHKQLRQPVCKGKPTGDPVTVTGVEID